MAGGVSAASGGSAGAGVPARGAVWDVARGRADSDGAGGGGEGGAGGGAGGAHVAGGGEGGGEGWVCEEGAGWGAGSEGVSGRKGWMGLLVVSGFEVLGFAVKKASMGCAGLGGLYTSPCVGEVGGWKLW